MRDVRISTRTILCALTLLASAPTVHAQSVEVHGFADVGVTLFTARQTFNTVLGSSNGVVFGGGAGVVLPQQIFVDVRATRFSKDGQRVFVDGGQTFDLGNSNTITITPVDVTVGYRFGRARDSVRPYAGGGISWYRYNETDTAASTGSDTVNQTFTGFHLLGGAEFRVSKWFGVGGELAWASVPNAIGQEPTSVGAAFNETNLGGTTFRAKVTIGR